MKEPKPKYHQSGIPDEHTHRIDGIYIDDFSSMCRFSVWTGLDHTTYHITMEHAQEIGFINIDALKSYCR
jgi:hypothetical protein